MLSDYVLTKLGPSFCLEENKEHGANQAMVDYIKAVADRENFRSFPSRDTAKVRVQDVVTPRFERMLFKSFRRLFRILVYIHR